MLSRQPGSRMYPSRFGSLKPISDRQIVACRLQKIVCLLILLCTGGFRQEWQRSRLEGLAGSGCAGLVYARLRHHDDAVCPILYMLPIHPFWSSSAWQSRSHQDEHLAARTACSEESPLSLAVSLYGVPVHHRPDVHAGFRKVRTFWSHIRLFFQQFHRSENINSNDRFQFQKVNKSCRKGKGFIQGVSVPK